MPEKVFHVSKVCERHSMRLGRLMLSEENEARELMERNSSFVAFYHMGSRSKVGQEAFRICVSGWEFGTPCREINDREYVVALSDHSDFTGLVEYVRRSKPKLVITDSFRSGYAEALAKEIHKRFSISTEALPTKQFPFKSENAGCF
jgi:predicted metal-dependent RNase